jgi:Xaa-Pro aminopeptidase
VSTCSVRSSCPDLPVNSTSSAAEQLSRAQTRAAELFQAIEERGLVCAGKSEEQVSESIFDLARAEFGVDAHWHRRVVRSGPHTRLAFRELPPDRVIESDDIVSLDLGPVFDSYEADFGRTYVIGADPVKLRLKADLERLFGACRDFYFERVEMTGSELYAHVVSACGERGWGFGGAHAGHLVGGFPLSTSERNAARNRVRPDNHWPMNAPADGGAPRHWILEIHLLDPGGTFGGFYEELLVKARASSDADGST